MNENQPSKFSIALKYGLLLGVIVIILNLIARLTGTVENTGLSIVYSILSLAAFITLLALAIKEYKKGNGGYASFGEAFAVSALAGTFAVILTNAFRYFYITFIDDTELRQIADKMAEERMKLEDRGMSEAEIDQALGVAELFTSPLMLVASSIFGILILSLIVSAVMKKSRPEFE